MQAGRYTFQAGMQTAGVEILDVHEGRTRFQSRYPIRYLCCGRLRTLRYSAMASRVQRGASMCNDCARSMNLRASGEEKVDSALPVPARTARDSAGMPWPFLGRLGRRGMDTLARWGSTHD